MIKKAWKKFVGVISGGVPKYIQPDAASSMGHLLIELGYISQDQLDAATNQINRGGIGEALVADELLTRGWVSADDITTVLDLQKRFRAGDELGARMEIAQMQLDAAKKAQVRLREAAKAAVPAIATMVSALQTG